MRDNSLDPNFHLILSMAAVPVSDSDVKRAIPNGFEPRKGLEVTAIIVDLYYDCSHTQIAP